MMFWILQPTEKKDESSQEEEEEEEVPFEVLPPGWEKHNGESTYTIFVQKI